MKIENEGCFCTLILYTEYRFRSQAWPDPFQKILKLTMGAGMTATLPPASLCVGAVGGIFVVSDETKRPDPAAMRRILDRYSDSPEGIILRLAWLHGLGRKELNELISDHLSSRFSTSRTNGPRLLSRVKAGTHPAFGEKSHTAAHTAKRVCP